jgi:hypothetical protein
MLGLAAFTGVAATGVVIARAERRRRAYTPQEIRERLHARLPGTPETRDAPRLPAIKSSVDSGHDSNARSSADE